MALVSLGLSLAMPTRKPDTCAFLLLCSGTISGFEKLIRSFKERCKTWKQITADVNERTIYIG